MTNINSKKSINDFIDIFIEVIINILGEEYRDIIIKRKKLISINYYSIPEHEHLFIQQYGDIKDYLKFKKEFATYLNTKKKYNYMYRIILYKYIIKHGLLALDYSLDDIDNGLYFHGDFEVGSIGRINDEEGLLQLKELTGNEKLSLIDIKKFNYFLSTLRTNYLYHTITNTKRGEYIRHFYEYPDEVVSNYYDEMSSCIGYNIGDDKTIYSVINVPIATKCITGKRQYIPVSIIHEYIHGLTTDQTNGNVGISSYTNGTLKNNCLNEVITQTFALYVINYLKKHKIDIKLSIDDYKCEGGSMYEKAMIPLHNLINEDNIVSIIKSIISGGSCTITDQYDEELLNTLDTNLLIRYMSFDCFNQDEKEQSEKLVLETINKLEHNKVLLNTKHGINN